MRYQTLVLTSLAVVAAIALADCGGASGSGGATPYAVATAASTPASSPSSTPTLAPAGSTTLAEAMLLGSPGFTNTNNFTVYSLSDDTVGSLACTMASGCLGVWPPVSPPNGVALSSGFTTFVRPDTGQTQLVFNNHPVYQYSGDAAAGQTNGNNLVSFGGTWTVARP
jgi:predicted lipoprotein with Yx(FWY)xxD motif